MVSPEFLRRSYEVFAAVEEDFNDLLDETLRPRSPSMLFDLVSRMNLPNGALVVDVGCGEGSHSLELATRFPISVVAIDPVERHLEIARQRFSEAGIGLPEVAARLRTALGFAHALPLADHSSHLIWCRDALVHVDSLDAAFGEFARTLKLGARALIFQTFRTDRLSSEEASWLLPTMGCVGSNMDTTHFEAAIQRSPLAVEDCLELSSEWGEYAQETSGRGGRKLLHAGRLLRDPERFRAQFGSANYDLALGDALWHVYRLIGKLSDRVYLLRRS